MGNKRFDMAVYTNKITKSQLKKALKDWNEIVEDGLYEAKKKVFNEFFIPNYIKENYEFIFDDKKKRVITKKKIK